MSLASIKYRTVLVLSFHWFYNRCLILFWIDPGCVCWKGLHSLVPLGSISRPSRIFWPLKWDLFFNPNPEFRRVVVLGCTAFCLDCNGLGFHKYTVRRTLMSWRMYAFSFSLILVALPYLFRIYLQLKLSNEIGGESLHGNKIHVEQQCNFQFISHLQKRNKTWSHFRQFLRKLFSILRLESNVHDYTKLQKEFLFVHRWLRYGHSFRGPSTTFLLLWSCASVLFPSIFELPHYYIDSWFEKQSCATGGTLLRSC